MTDKLLTEHHDMLSLLLSLETLNAVGSTGPSQCWSHIPHYWKSHVHAREPLYSNSAVIAWWSQSTSGKNSVFMCTLLSQKGNKFLNILLLGVFFADYCY